MVGFGIQIQQFYSLECGHSVTPSRWRAAREQYSRRFQSVDGRSFHYVRSTVGDCSRSLMDAMATTKGGILLGKMKFGKICLKFQDGIFISVLSLRTEIFPLFLRKGFHLVIV